MLTINNFKCLNRIHVEDNVEHQRCAGTKENADNNSSYQTINFGLIVFTFIKLYYEENMKY